VSKSSLIPPEALALIGKESAPVTREVYAKDVRRFCYAVGDLNPLYLDEAYARETPFAGTIAPPMFFDIPTVSEHPQEELRTDGLTRDGLLPPVKAARSMAGGNEIEFFKAIRVGDRITRISKIADIYEKEGRSGPLVFTIIENRYSNQNGDLVAVERMTVILW
jgi:3-methylfumaryl-CoA hydratase